MQKIIAAVIGISFAFGGSAGLASPMADGEFGVNMHVQDAPVDVWTNQVIEWKKRKKRKCYYDPNTHAGATPAYCI